MKTKPEYHNKLTKEEEVRLTERLTKKAEVSELTIGSKLTKEEEVRLTERLRKIESEQAIAWGLHRLSGGFVKAEYDECDEERIYITLTDGIQSDCCNRTNVTHCSLWRNTLEWTD